MALKQRLSSLTMNQLSELTGISYRTLKKRLSKLDHEEEDLNAKYYNSREALEIIYLGTPDDRKSGDDSEPGGGINMRMEAGRNIKLKNDHLQFDLDVKKGKYAPIEDIRKMWNDQAVAFRSRLRQLSTQLAEDVHGIDDVQKIQVIIERGHDEALNEMANDGNTDRLEEADGRSDDEASTSAEADDLSVG